MKRTPLKRTSPLRRTGKLAPVSKKQKGRLARYRAMLAKARTPTAVCPKCEYVTTWDKFEMHHPFGRGGDNLFRVIPLCRLCHAWVHAFPNDAYRAGLLQPEYRGLPHDPSHPQPWKKLITEHP